MFEHSIDLSIIERASRDAQRAFPDIKERLNVEAYCSLSMPFRMIRQDSLSALWSVPQLVEAFAALLKRVSDPSLRIDAVDADRSKSGLVAAWRWA